MGADFWISSEVECIHNTVNQLHSTRDQTSLTTTFLLLKWSYYDFALLYIKPNSILIATAGYKWSMTKSENKFDIVI